MRLIILFILFSLLSYGQRLDLLPKATTVSGTDEALILQTTGKMAPINLIRGFSSFGSPGQFLRVNVAGTGIEFFSTITETKGGTGLTSYSTGDILYASGTNTLAKLAAGTNGHVLTLSGGLPVWQAASGGGGSGTVTSIATSNGLTGGTITTSGTISGINAQANASTKGVATYVAGDFNDNGSGTIALDYANGQEATSGQDGFLSSTDWSTFNGKQSAITTGTTAQYFRGDLSLATFPTNVSTFSNDAGYVTASSTNTFTNKSGNISQWTNDSGYITSSGTAASVANAATFNNSGSGAASGTTFDGSASRTISYNTLGALGLGVSNSTSANTTISGSSGHTAFTVNSIAGIGINVSSTGSFASIQTSGAQRVLNATTSNAGAAGTGAIVTRIDNGLGGNIFGQTWNIVPNNATTAGTKLIMDEFTIKQGDGGSNISGGDIAHVTFENTIAPLATTGYEFRTLNNVASGTAVVARIQGNKLAIGADVTPTATIDVTGEGTSTATIADLKNGSATSIFKALSNGEIQFSGSAGSSGQLLKSNGSGAAPTWITISGGGDALVANSLSQFAATTSTELAGVITDETGTGGLVFATNPTFTNALSIANGGTNNGSLSVTQGSIYFGDGSKLVALSPGTSGQFLKTQGAAANPIWDTPSGSGDVLGAASSTDNALVRFDGTTGKTIQNSGIIVTDDNELQLAAGTTTSSPINIQSGTLETTPDDGDIEADADVVYLTTDAGNRGVVEASHWRILDADRSLTNSTAEQAIFDSPTALTLEAGTYRFEAQIYITGMSATSGNAAFDILGSGSATISEALYSVWGIDNNSPLNVGTRTGGMNNAAQSGTSMVSGGTGTGLTATIRGIFKVSAGGSVVPSITLLTASAATMKENTYFSCNRIGSSTLTAIGDWN